MRTYRVKEFSVREVAAELGISSYEVFKLINSGKLKAYRFGGHYRFVKKHIDDYKRSRLEEGNNGGMDET